MASEVRVWDLWPGDSQFTGKVEVVEKRHLDAALAKIQRYEKALELYAGMGDFEIKTLVGVVEYDLESLRKIARDALEGEATK